MDVRASTMGLLYALVTLTACSGGRPDSSPTGPQNGVAASVRVSLSDTVFFVGGTVQATATTYTSSNTVIAGQAVRWSISDTTMAAINSTGVVTALKAGSISVIAEILGAGGAVALSGSAAVRAKYEPGTWYMSDSLVVPYAGLGGVGVALPLPGNKAAYIFGGSDYNSTGTALCGRVPPAYVEIDASGHVSWQAGRIVETTQTLHATGFIYTADFNGDGNADLFFGGMTCDVPNPGKDLADPQKIFLGDGAGGFREAPLPQIKAQLHSATIGVSRPGGPVDLFAMSALCLNGTGDTLAVEYRGVNWRAGCLAPGPWIFRGKGDGAFTYDNTSLYTPLAISIVGDGVSPTVPNVAGSAVCDVNGDGANDLVTTYKSPAPGRPAGQVYLNDKSGRFLTAPIPLPLPSSVGSMPTMYCRDFDRDGRVDLLMTRVDPSNSGTGNDYGMIGNSATALVLLHGNGDGTFTDITSSAFPGQALEIWSHWHSFADINNDGFLDIVGMRPEYKGGTTPVWLGTATPGVFRNATPREVPSIQWNVSGTLSPVTAWHLFAVKAGTETMLVSHVGRTGYETNLTPPMSLIPPRSAVVRVFRRTQ